MSWLSKEHTKAYKSLEAYNFFISGNYYYMELNYMELMKLLEKCHDIQLSITEAECKLKSIEKEMQNQAASKVWFAQRAGRITASKLKAACRTDISKPSKSLIKQICYPEAYKFFSCYFMGLQEMYTQIKFWIHMKIL
jgi:hypothetical protein